MKHIYSRLGLGIIACALVAQCIFVITLLVSIQYLKTSREQIESGKQVLAQTTTTLKESFIPLGTGAIQGNQWTDVPGLQVQIDTTRYPKLKQVLFEVGVENPNNSGTIYVQLYNITGGYSVWTSQVSSDTSSAYLVSSPVTLATGSNLYKVQMYNTLNAPSTLVQARLRMVSN